MCSVSAVGGKCTSVSWQQGVFGVTGCTVEKVVLQVAPDHEQARLNDVLKTYGQEKHWPNIMIQTTVTLYIRRSVKDT